jgi:DNA invertase Pin-like site-specific DNA recombinase
MLIGYARVSTNEQNLDLQRDALLKAGVGSKDIYTDKVTGVKAERPGLTLALSHLRKGDTLIVWRLDRLVLCHFEIIGYSLCSFTRASAVVNCQCALACCAFLWAFHA